MLIVKSQFQVTDLFSLAGQPLHKRGRVWCQKSRVQDHGAVIGRWSPPWNLSKQVHPRSEANQDLPMFSSHRRAKLRSMDSSYSHHGFRPLLDSSWLWQHFEIERRLRCMRSHDSVARFLPRKTWVVILLMLEYCQIALKGGETHTQNMKNFVMI